MLALRATAPRLLRPDMFALLGHRALHHQYQNRRAPAARTAHSQKTSKKARDAACCCRRSSSDVDAYASERTGSPRPLQKRPAGPHQKRLDVAVQRAEAISQAGEVELLAPLLDGRCHRGADTAPLGAEQAEQSHCRAAEMYRRVPEGGHVDRGEQASPGPAISIRGQTTCVGLIWRFIRASQ